MRLSSASASRTIRRCSSAWITRRRCWRSRARRQSFSLPPVAIVGARNASLAGIKMARMLAARARSSGLRRRLRPGARHRHRRTSRQPADRHRRGSRRSASTSPIRLKTSTCSARSSPAAARAALRNAVRLGAPPAGFPAPQPHHRRPVPRASSWSKQRRNPARLSARVLPARWAGWSSPCPARRSTARLRRERGLLKDGAILVTEASRISSKPSPAAGAAIQLPPKLDEPRISARRRHRQDSDRERRGRGARTDAGRHRRDHHRCRTGTQVFMILAGRPTSPATAGAPFGRSVSLLLADP